MQKHNISLNLTFSGILNFILSIIFSVVIILCVVLLLSSTGCKKSSSDTSTTTEAVVDSTSNIAEAAMSEAGSQASATEGASSPFMASIDGFDTELQEFESDLINPADVFGVNPQAACSYSSARGACSSTVATVTWGSCTIGTVTMTGGWTETYSSNAVCTAGNLATGTNGDYVDRASTSQVATLVSGITVTTDTQGGTAYDGVAVPAGAIRTTKGASSRTIVSNPTTSAVHRVLKGPLGTTWFDYYVFPNLTVTGTRALSTRTATGTVTIKHNRALYSASHSFPTTPAGDVVTWGSSSCCYPTSGKITSTLSGAVSGTTTLTFSATCGAATFVDTDGASSSLTLTRCN
jgi:hypothetical protein